MPKHITVFAYQFSELDEEGKERARNWWRQSAHLDGWSEPVTDDFIACAALLGWEIAADDIAWSGFWSQGDGASFTGEWHAKNCQLDKLRAHAPTDTALHVIGERIAAIARRNPSGFARMVRTGRHYSHSHTVDLSDAFADSETDSEMRSADWVELRDASRALADWLYSQLEKEHEYRHSDDAIAEDCAANEYEFTGDGRRFVVPSEAN